MKAVYLAQVICKGDSCYQFVTKEYAEAHPDFNIIKLFESNFRLNRGGCGKVISITEYNNQEHTNFCRYGNFCHECQKENEHAPKEDKHGMD